MRCAVAVAMILGLAAPVRADPPGPPFRPEPQAETAAQSVAPFRDWTLDCAAECFIATAIRPDRAGAEDVLRLSLRQDAENGTVGWELRIETPLPLYLPDPVILTPEDSPPLPIAWFTCDPEGCQARLLADAPLLEALKRQRAASVEVTLVDGSHARLRFSLLGFSAAFAALGLSPAP